MTNSLPPSNNKSLLWILAAVVVVVIMVIVLSSACRSNGNNTSTPSPQPIATTSSPSPSVPATTAPAIPSPIAPVPNTTPPRTWPSEAEKAQYLRLIASIDPGLVGSQSAVDSLLEMGIMTCSYLDEAVRVSDNEQAVVMTGMDTLVKSLIVGGFAREEAIKIAATILNSAISAMCPEHRALLAIAIAPEGTPA